MRYQHLSATAIALLVVSASAGAQVTFDPFADPGQYTHRGNCYSEAGLMFTDVTRACGEQVLVSWGSSSVHYTGTPAMFNDYGNRMRITTSTGTGTFDLYSLDVAQIYAGYSGFNDSFITLTGWDGTAFSTSTFTWSSNTGTPALHTHTLNWNNMVYVEYSGSSPGYSTLQVDNIRSDVGAGVVPEPSSVVLMASGLIGVAVAARRRRKA